MKVIAEGKCCNCGGDVEIETDAEQLLQCDWYAYDDDEGHCFECGMQHSVSVDADTETANLLPVWDSLDNCP